MHVERRRQRPIAVERYPVKRGDASVGFLGKVRDELGDELTHQRDAVVPFQLDVAIHDRLERDWPAGCDAGQTTYGFDRMLFGRIERRSASQFEPRLAQLEDRAAFRLDA